MAPISTLCHRLLLIACCAPAATSWATDEAPYELPKYTTFSAQVANQTPVASYAAPVSGLRFEPRVDVQARNFAEAQADVTIRGGIFENTGFKLGATSLYDPQTGHYFAEIPVAPAMLESPRILTGLDNAQAGFNAGVGSIASAWRPIEQRGELSVASGNHETNRVGLYQGLVGGDFLGQTMAADVDLSQSKSDGSVPFGDHDFERASGRMQWRGANSQTDLFAGVQHKFFGWPDLYTPFGVNETEDLHTGLFLLNHRQWTSTDEYWEVGAAYRRNDDDYEFNRAVPGQFNPYQHTTHTQSFSLEGRRALPALPDGYLGYGVQVMRDGLQSTALTFGRFNTRNYLKLSLLPEARFTSPAGEFTFKAGATYDDTNRDKAAVSPLIGIDLQGRSGLRWHGEYSESTQVPTYTALNSAPAAGLFRGNALLGRETSRNLEFGATGRGGEWSVSGAAFYRWDDNLVDWTFTRAVPAARKANAVDTGTAGLEIVASHKTAHSEIILGYTFLDKTADYGSATVDASFYALNYARHRLTAAFVLRLGGGLELRSDNEFRIQEKNLLRVVGGDHAVLSSLGLYYLPPRMRGLELSLLIDNLWDIDFQDVPAVPAARRLYSLGAAYRW
ncbi:MAG TPA: TonB-dependent receptor [Lacunisphaera sp.]|nr:TonB-dependent receptor [Lacunisphaera sp.]